MDITITIDKANKCCCDTSLYVNMRYDYNLVDLIRKLPSRYWYQDEHIWEIPYNKLDYLKGIFSQHNVSIVDARNSKPDETCVEHNEYTFKTKPYEHQIAGFEYGMKHKKWLLCDEQGLGKTKQVIDIAVAKKLDGFKKCLIVCCVNGLKWNWCKEVSIHSDESAYILGQRTRKDGKVYIGSSKDKYADVENLEHIPDYFIVTNVESLRDIALANKLQSCCLSGLISMVAVDEIHKCKNASSQQGKGILRIQPNYRIAMTGTPIMNSPLDLYVVLKWLGYEKHSFYAFKNHYCVTGGYGGYEVIGYKNMAELTDATRDIMLRRLKENVLDLPEKIYIDEFVEMTTKQEQIYKEVSADIKANIDMIKMSNNPLAELIRLRQATGYTGILSSTILESAKLDRLEEIVEESVANNRKVVIFSNWTQMTTPIYNRLSKKYKGIIITGDTADVERQVNVNTFQTNDECKFALGTIGAMGTGITLTAGNIVVFMDEPWNMANKQQAIDRCHRIGTTDNVLVYTIICKNTIDERIHSIVENKGLISDEIIDGKLSKNKSEVLEFLLS